MTASPQPSRGSCAATRARHEAIFARFDEAWQKGPPPRLEDYLPADPGERVAVLAELVHIDLEFRLKAGVSVRVEDYWQRYPELARGREVALSLVAAEFDLRRRFAPDATVLDYQRRFPQFGDELGTLLENRLRTPEWRDGPSALLPGGASRPPGADGGTPVAVPGYEILGELGRGGMGVVYKARQTSLKRLVALKMVLAGGHAGPEELARFRSEAEAVARLQHPNVVQIYEVGEHDGRPYFSLEFMDGGSLAGQLAGRPQPPAEAAQLVETLARAMHHCHQAGIVHRDLKPANVLLRRKNQEPRTKNQEADADSLDLGSWFFEPKVSDFGLAKQLESDLGRTRTGAVLGTPAYMAPEQAAGKVREVGPAADVYALGAILYELLTGQPPFRGVGFVEILEQVRSREPAPPSRLRPGVPRDLETVCLKCLQKEPGRRYGSALALAQDLERFRLGEAILARPEGPVGKLWRKVRRNAVVSAAVLVVVLALAVAGAVFLLTGEAREEARVDRLVTEAYQKIQDGLGPAEWTAAHLAEMDGHVAELERLGAAGQAAEARKSVREHFARAVREQIGAPRLETEHRTRIERALALLARRDEAAARLLRQELANRLHGWGTVFELPRDRPDAVFDAAAGVVAEGPLFGRVPRPTAPGPQADAEAVVLSRHPSRQEARLEAVFDRTWEAAPAVGLLLGAARGHTHMIYCLEFSADGRLLVSASGADDRPGEVKVWDVARRWEVSGYSADKPGSLWAALAPDETRLAVGHGREARVVFLDPATGRVLGGFEADRTGVACLAYSPDGKLLATATGVPGKSGEVSLWDPATGKKQATLGGFKDVAARLTFSPDGRLLAAGSNDRTIKVWEVATRREKLSTVPLHLDFISCGKFSPDSRWFVAPAHTDERQRGKLVGAPLLWDTTTGRVGTFDAGAHAGGLSAFAFAPDGKTLAVASAWGRSVLLRAMPNGTLRRFLTTGPAPGGRIFTALVFAPDGKTLATAADDRSVRLWDVATANPRSAFEDRSYAFLLRAPAPAAGKPAAPLQVVRAAGGAFRLQILRNGVLLREQQAAAAQVPRGELRLTATREGGRLVLQVNDLPPLEFEDAQPLGRGGPGAFGLVWPAGVRLARLRAARRSLPPAASPLERGDEAYGLEQYPEALALYQEQARAPGAGPAGQEARVKAAYCLRALGREAEAADLFERVAAEEGDRWPVVAGAELLRTRVRQRRFADADAVFEVLLKRHGPEQIAGLVPRDVLDGIVAAYAADFSDLGLFLARPGPRGLHNLERARLIQDFFGVPPPSRVALEQAFLRAYHIAGRLDDAARVARDLLANREYWPGGLDDLQRAILVEHYCWVLRERGSPAEALAQLEAQVLEGSGVYRSGFFVPLLLERARDHVALGRWAEAEKDLDDYFARVPPGGGEYFHHAIGCLIRGFLRERRGDPAGARAAWRQGLYRDWWQAAARAHPAAPPPPLARASPAVLFHGLIVGSLAGELGESEAQEILTRLVAHAGGSAPAALFQKGVLKLPPAILRDLCGTAKGSDAARHMAFKDVAYAEYLRLPALMFAAEVMHQGALPGPLPAEQGAVLWEVADKLQAAHAADKLSTAQFFQLALAWKGTSNFLGWAGLAPGLAPSLRGPLAYVMGHRYVRLKRDPEASGLFRTARDDTPPGSVLHRLAQAELDRLKAK
jgi:WD40 repeat protein